MSESEHNPSTQPAAAGGHNLQPRRGWPPSPLNPLNLLNPLNPHAAGVSKAATTTLSHEVAVKPKNPKNLRPFRAVNPHAAKRHYFI
jgi:hypothetical protein